MSRFNVVTELRLGGAWVDISGDVYQRDDVRIVRGRPDEGSKTDPATCSLTLNNRAGKYSPRNPAGPYYGLLTRNTPIRVTVGIPIAGATGFEDVVTSGDHVAPSANARADRSLLIGSWVASQFFEAPGDYTVPASMTSDGELDGGFATMVSATESLSTSGDTGSRTAAYSKTADGWAAANLVVPGESGVPVVEEFQSDVAGNAAITFVTSPETLPGEWLVVIHAWNFDAAGFTSVDMLPPSGTPGEWLPVADTGVISNAAPHLIGWARRVGVGGPQEVTLNADLNDNSYNNHARLYRLSGVAFSSLRFCGEVSAFPVRWDVSDTDVYVPVKASGILRRLGQGAKALRSPIYRETLSPRKRTPRAYWPCEDRDGASQIGSAVDSGFPMAITGGPDLAAFDNFAGSQSVPVMKTGRFEGVVQHYPPTSGSQVQWIMHVDGNGPPADGAPIFQFITDGGASRWQVRYESGGSLSVRVFAPDQSILSDTGPVAFDVNNRLLRCALEIRESGGDIEHVLAVFEEGASTAVSWTGPVITGRTTGTITKITFGLRENLGDTAIGHISVHDEATSIFDLEGAFRAWTGESAGRRIERLCREENVGFDGIGDLDDTQPMGPQGANRLLDLVQEAADADGGVMYESRSRIGLVYRTRFSLYNQEVL